MHKLHPPSEGFRRTAHEIRRRTAQKQEPRRCLFAVAQRSQDAEQLRHTLDLVKHHQPMLRAQRLLRHGLQGFEAPDRLEVVPRHPLPMRTEHLRQGGLSHLTRPQQHRRRRLPQPHRQRLQQPLPINLSMLHIERLPGDIQHVKRRPCCGRRGSSCRQGHGCQAIPVLRSCSSSSFVLQENRSSRPAIEDEDDDAWRWCQAICVGNLRACGDPTGRK